MAKIGARELRAALARALEVGGDAAGNTRDMLWGNTRSGAGLGGAIGGMMGAADAANGGDENIADDIALGGLAGAGIGGGVKYARVMGSGLSRGMGELRRALAEASGGRSPRMSIDDAVMDESGADFVSRMRDNGVPLSRFGDDSDAATIDLLRDRRMAGRVASDLEGDALMEADMMGKKYFREDVDPDAGIMGGNLPGASGSFATNRERQLYQLMHDHPEATDDMLAEAMGVPMNILNILKRRLQRGGFDIENRGRPEGGGPMDRGEY